MIATLRRLAARRATRSVRRRTIPVDGRLTLHRRVRLLAAFGLVWAVVIQGRLVYLQVLRHDDMVTRAERQHLRTVNPPGKRGDIVDRKGRVLATSVDADSIYAVPSEIGDPAAAVTALCGALGDCTARDRRTLTERFSRKSPFVYVRRQVSPDDARRVAALNLDGIGFLKESQRRYPKKELAAHVLGYVGTDNKGLNGIESAYDRQIRGEEGRILIQTDARHRAFSRFERPPTQGASLELSIDEFLQHVAERELRAGVAENRALGGSAIVMDPRTGEILAMANEPTFNPNVFRDASDVERRNRSVQDLYEPGSTFKIVTASAALESGVMAPSAMIDTRPGVIRINAGHIVNEFRGHNYGVLSFSDVIVQSSNVGAIKIGFKIGKERLSEYVDRFGFGRTLSADFPGESPGIVWSPERWTDSALASVSMGYQVAVTPLQMVAAISAVANGGSLMEPRVVRALYQGDRRFAVRPKRLREVIDRDTAASLTAIMEDVVERGTAKLAQIPGYTIAGKTGTASKLINGRYSANENNVSFVGFAPSREPAVAIIVVLDSPRGTGNSGGTVSAPIFKRIAEASLNYLGVSRTINPDPPVIVARRADPSPAPAAIVDVAASAPRAATPVRRDIVPDVRGMSAREAVKTLTALGVGSRLSGNGTVIAQNPAPGTPLTRRIEAVLTLSRRSDGGRLDTDAPRARSGTDPRR